MKAARSHGGGEPLRIEAVPEPVLRPGSAIIRVRSTFVPPVTASLLGAEPGYILPPTPFTPGMDTIGTVEEVADDVAGIEPGEAVYCDHYHPPGHCFLGAFGMSRDSIPVLARWPDGGFAERLVLPAEHLTPLGDAASVAPEILCRLGWLGTAYGGLVRAGLGTGQCPVITGATGLLGTGGILLALAMGAGRIVALGRRRAMLDALAALDPRRIIPVMVEDGESTGKVIAAAAGGADVVLDAIGDTDDAAMTRGAIRALGRGGRVAFVGGLTTQPPVTATYMVLRGLTILGSTWFPRAAAREILAMIGSGALDLSSLSVRTFPLARVNDAIAAAGDGGGGLEHVALVP
jgi:alcohol dehydrogenase